MEEELDSSRNAARRFSDQQPKYARDADRQEQSSRWAIMENRSFEVLIEDGKQHKRKSLGDEDINRNGSRSFAGSPKRRRYQPQDPEEIELANQISPAPQVAPPFPPMALDENRFAKERSAHGDKSIDALTTSNLEGQSMIREGSFWISSTSIDAAEEQVYTSEEPPPQKREIRPNASVSGPELRDGERRWDIERNPFREQHTFSSDVPRGTTAEGLPPHSRWKRESLRGKEASRPSRTRGVQRSAPQREDTMIARML